MAWMSGGRSNTELISNMMRNGLLTSQRVIEAMNKVDRANYVKSGTRPYDDSPASIGFGATISAPHMHAHAAENLLPYLNPGAKVLDIGSGSGYTCAIFHHLVSPQGEAQGKVIGIDHIPQLVNWSVENLKKDGLTEPLNNGNIAMITGDGRLGNAEHAPYDVIHVGAAAPVLPEALIAQLNSPGRMFIPVGTYSQEIVQVDKDSAGKVTEQRLFGVRYVPLTDREAQSP
ncbi:hypothetical protein BOTBODRAFT_57565 [Botryobasidium botryosum FD-172 SS1]|uniref:protein-L-isoaspartate(D-aspartate) O-methyltransferase n=1 Tax=Botryobasidium botryosum (strain FD-172 SS1) TaxID=930990 RepID=A0A067M973_BOTB1|nr:hypothetical protein BOTBODRAFT_57565 [Botryobasidium botryosum FD-172 SS1]